MVLIPGKVFCQKSSAGDGFGFLLLQGRMQEKRAALHSLGKDVRIFFRRKNCLIEKRRAEKNSLGREMISGPGKTCPGISVYLMDAKAGEKEECFT